VATAGGGDDGVESTPEARLLDTLLESSQYGLMLLNERLRVAWISHAGAAALRYDADAMIGRRAAEFLDPSQSPGVLEAIGEVLAASDEEAPGWQLGVRVRLVCGDGVSRDFEFGGRTVIGNDTSELMLVFLDVSERARLEDVLTAVMERDLETALRRFLNLASSQLRSKVGVALHPSLGSGTYVVEGARPGLLDDLSTDREDATVRPITSPNGTMFGWLVVDRDELTAWGVETTERLVSLLGLVLSNQATFSDLVDAAATDPLTGLSNRRVLDVAIVAAQATADHGWALLYCDLDRFKSINDQWGHDAGDVVLRIVADRLRHVVRSGDIIARIGGDEFVILAQTDPEQAALLAERLRDSVAEPIVDARGRFEVGISVGVASAATPDEVRDLLARADAAMRRDKADRQAVR
jgi:diguanylate cyclase (GGDEF)-like protein